MSSNVSQFKQAIDKQAILDLFLFSNLCSKSKSKFICCVHDGWGHFESDLFEVVRPPDRSKNQPHELALKFVELPECKSAHRGGYVSSSYIPNTVILIKWI